MGNKSSGFKNENNIIEYIDKKKIKDLNENMKKFILYIFNIKNEDAIIQATSGEKGEKTDIIIKINDEIKRVSVKIGSGNSVHQENIDVFVEFLKSINIPENIIYELLKYHWGDGTSDGTGTERISGPEYKRKFPEEIKTINTELNKKENLKLFIDRFIIQGKSSDYHSIDVLYYGDINEGHWAKKEEIIEYIVNNIFKMKSIHFGPVTYQIWNRCLNFNKNTENRRRVMQIKWASLYKDLLVIERNRKNE